MMSSLSHITFSSIIPNPSTIIGGGTLHSVITKHTYNSHWGSHRNACLYATVRLQRWRRAYFYVLKKSRTFFFSLKLYNIWRRNRKRKSIISAWVLSGFPFFSKHCYQISHGNSLLFTLKAFTFFSLNFHIPRAVCIYGRPNSFRWTYDVQLWKSCKLGKSSELTKGQNYYIFSN